MKNDYIERFIQDNLENWNDKKAPDGLWDKIEDDLNFPVDNANTPWARIIILLSVIIGLLIFLNYLIGTNNKKSTDNGELLEFAELEGFHETENFYISAIEVSYEKLRIHDVDATLEEDLSLLDQNYKELIEEYKVAQGAYKEQILRAIIQNHKTKLEILENVLYHIQQNDKNETPTIL